MGDDRRDDIDDRDDGANAIRVRGARTHNLRSVDVDVPRDRLVVLTGVSGSGKSSLAFDTIYAEGQRRYIESLSTFARQMLDQLQRPDVDAIDGLPPTVAVDQHAGAPGPRSTVGTMSEELDFLRLLFARAGLAHCPKCGQPVRRQSPEQVVSAVLERPEGQKVIVLAPLARGRKGSHVEAFELIRRRGLLRARVDGQIIEVQDAPKLDRNKAHDVDAVVDRLVIRPGIRPRLAESVDRALELGDGTLRLSLEMPGGTWVDTVASTKLGCPDCGVGLEPPEPRDFSFNSPHGACPTCEGLGTVARFDPELVLPDRSVPLSLEALAVRAALRPRQAEGLLAAMEAVRTRFKVRKNAPLAKWPEKALAAMFGGDEKEEGTLARLEAMAEAATDAGRAALDAFRTAERCPECLGARLKAASRAVTIDGLSLPGLGRMTITEAAAWLSGLSFSPPLDQVGAPIIREVVRRLGYLDRVGLSYLSLDRPSASLSGGELQRVRLAAQLGSGLVGVAFVLDEPTAGLHPRDTARLLDTLRDLRDAGNSVLVVEHDEATIREADWVIDLGPGAGPDGGRIVAMGPPGALSGAESATARYLAEGPSASSSSLSLPPDPSPPSGWITIEGATEHNLQGETARFPLGRLTCVTGVSGSGKSTLVLDVLAQASRRFLAGGGASSASSSLGKVSGLEAIERLIVIDQAPIGRTPRSTPATYTGLYDAIRHQFARTREARVRGWTTGRFSFNVKGGRCEACQGQGLKRVPMQFLPDLFVRCEACDGRRFNAATLQAKYQGRSIAEVLDLRVDEAAELFDAVPKVRSGLLALREVGLGYITLGQPSTTLSGGEAQRVKLAAELGRPAGGRTLYVLDEPTTGLHFVDVARLASVLRRLVAAGHTVVVIEHNLELIRGADWVIDLGPEGGPAGGRIVAIGPPAAIAAEPSSFTGAYLRGVGRS
jgi:excinuclease ABC subunit A